MKTQTATISQTLSCISCGNQSSVGLTPVELARLLSEGEIQLFCSACETLTRWYTPEIDRRIAPRRRKLVRSADTAVGKTKTIHIAHSGDGSFPGYTFQNPK